MFHNAQLPGNIPAMIKGSDKNAGKFCKIQPVLDFLPYHYDITQKKVLTLRLFFSCQLTIAISVKPAVSARVIFVCVHCHDI